MAGKKSTASVVEIEGMPAEPIQLIPLGQEEIEVSVVGTTPLIIHKWSEKAKKMMRDKQQGKASAKKAPKDPQEEADEVTYWLPDGTPGIPAAAFKIATVDATRYFERAVSFELLKRVIRVHGEGPEQLVPIIGQLNPTRGGGSDRSNPGEPREDSVRVGMGTADLRYRNEIWPWQATLRVRYLTTVLTPESLIALVNAGGIGGVGEMRPSSPKAKGGTYGCYEVMA